MLLCLIAGEEWPIFTVSCGKNLKKRRVALLTLELPSGHFVSSPAMKFWIERAFLPTTKTWKIGQSSHDSLYFCRVSSVAVWLAHPALWFVVHHPFLSMESRSRDTYFQLLIESKIWCHIFLALVAWTEWDEALRFWNLSNVNTSVYQILTNFKWSFHLSARTFEN